MQASNQSIEDYLIVSSKSGKAASRLLKIR